MDRYVTRIGDVTIQRVVPKDDMAPESHTGHEDEEEEEDDIEEEDEEEDVEAYKADDPVQDDANPSDHVENMDESVPCHEGAGIDGVPAEGHEVLESLENASGEVASVMDSSELLRNIKEEPMEQDMSQDPTSEEDSMAKDLDEKEVPEHEDESTKRKQDSDLESEVGLKKKKQDEDNETDKKKALNMRRNIREVMDENQLDEATLAAQRQEMERLRRVQDQQKYLRDVQRQMQINRQNHKTQSRVISLLQGNTSMSVLKGKSAVFGSQASVPVKPSGSVSLVKLGSDAPPQVLDKKVLDAIRGDRSQSPPSNTKPGVMRTLGSKHMVTPSVTIAPVKSTPFAKEKKDTRAPDVVTISSSDDDEERGEAREERPSEVVTRLSDDDDCIVLSDPSDDEEEADVDPTNSGMHTNDLFNTPDEQGRVLINVGKQEGEPEIFLAPQIARIIKPHQIGGVRFLFDNVVESVERFKNSTGFGCILAHSMGLGKTLQVVSFCDVFLRETTARTVMCIMPINTLQNWVAEFNIWLPMDATNSPLAAQGEVRTRDFRIFVLNDFHKTIVSRSKVVAEWQREGGVLLIGYEMYRQLSLKRSGRVRKGKKRPPDEDMEDEKNKPLIEQMHEALVKPGPDLVICDEGHRIKNSHASISHALKQIRTKRRIVLTGYPLQNNLLEYWCMVDFVRPNYLGTKTEFSNMFERPIQNGQCIDSTPQDIRLMRYRAHVLHSLLEGFVQRRSHSVLRNTLPQKEEYVLLVRMTPFQRKLYDTFMNEVVRTKAVPNPLKAFAVCCKIWNHPDILYNFLKKREMDELQDLDIDETTVMAQRAAGQEVQPTLSPRGRKSDKKGKGGKKAQAVAVPMKSPVVAAVPPTTSQSQVEVKTEEPNTFDGFNYYQQYNNNSRNFEQPPTSSAPTSSNYNYQNYNYNYNNYNYNESNYNYNSEYNYNNNYYQQQQQQQQSPQGQGYNYNYQGRQVKTEPGTEIDFKNIKKEEKKEDVLKQTFCRGLSGGEVVFNQSSYQNQYEERAPFQGGFDFNQFGQNFGNRNQSSFNWNQEYDEFQGDKKKLPGKKTSQEKKDSFMQDEYYRNDAFSGDYCTDKKRENQVGMNFDTGLMGQQREMQQNFGYQKDEIKCNQRGQYEQDMMQNPVSEQNQDMENVQMMGSGLNLPGNSGMQNHSAYQQPTGYQSTQNQIDMQNMPVHKHNQIGYGNQQQPASAQVQHLPANNTTVQNQMLDQTGSQNSTSQSVQVGHQMAHHQASPSSQMHMAHHQINSTQGLAQNVHHQGMPMNGANTQNQVGIHQAVQGTPNQSMQTHQNVHMMNTTVNTPNQMIHRNMPDTSGQVMQMHQNMPMSGNTLNQTVQMHQNMPMSGNAPNQSMQMNMLNNNQGMPMTSSASVPPNQNVLAHQSIPMTSNPTNQGMQMQQNTSSTAITPNQSMQIHVNMPSNNQGMQLHQNMSNQGMHMHESMPMQPNTLNQNVPMNANQSNVLNQIGNQSLQMQAMMPNSNPNNQTIMHQSGNLPGQSMLHQNGNNTSGQNMQMHQGMPITSSASIAPNQIMHMHQSVPVNNTPSNQNMQMHQSMPANNNPNNQGVPMTSSASIAPNQGMLIHQSLSTNNQGMQIHQSMPMTSNASITPNQSMQMHQSVPMNTSSNNQSVQMHQNMPMTSSSSVAPNQSMQIHQSVPMNTNSNNQSMQMHQNMPMTSSSSAAPNQSMQMHQSVSLNTSSNSQGMQMTTSDSIGPNQSMQMHQNPMGAPNQGLPFHQNPTNQLNQGMPLHTSLQQNISQGLAQTSQQSQGTQMTQKADGGTKPDSYHEYQTDYQAENDKRRGDFYHQGQYYNQNFPDFPNFQNSYPYGPQAGPSGLGKMEQKEKRGMSCQTDPIDKDDKVPYDKAETEKRLFEQWDKEEGGKTKDDSAPSRDKKEEESPKKFEAAPPVHKPAKEEPGIPYDWATELLKGYIPGDINSSAKMAVFFCILEESIALGDRILLFSQSLFTLNLIEELLQQQQVYGKTEKWAKNVNYYRLDGSTTAIEREKLINEFNSNPNLHLFLVSTRAGSLGINLVGANRVIVFDASWNPCHDTQAVCRVYRYGQKKPCFVYRLVTDNCLEKKIYDRQINKQGMSDRVVDECNPDAHLSIKEVTSLCWDDKEDETLRDFTDLQDSYIDVVIQKVLQKHSSLLSKEPFQHESLLVDRKEKKLSQAEKRLAKRSYELEKQASTSTSRPPYYNNPVNSQGAIIRGPDKPMASVRPMQSELSSQLVRDGGPRQRGWIPASVWQRQGMSAQEMTLPLDVVIPTNAPDRSSIVLKAGQKVMVLKSPKGIYMQLENGKIIAIRTAFKVKDKEQQQQLQPKKGLDVRGRGSLPNLRNNNVTITPTRPSPHRPHRPVRAVGPVTRPPVTVTVTRKRPVGIPGVPEAPTVLEESGDSDDDSSPAARGKEFPSQPVSGAPFSDVFRPATSGSGTSFDPPPDYPAPPYDQRPDELKGQEKGFQPYYYPPTSNYYKPYEYPGPNPFTAAAVASSRNFDPYYPTPYYPPFMSSQYMNTAGQPPSQPPPPQ